MHQRRDLRTAGPVGDPVDAEPLSNRARRSVGGHEVRRRRRDPCGRFPGRTAWRSPGLRRRRSRPAPYGTGPRRRDRPGARAAPPRVDLEPPRSDWPGCSRPRSVVGIRHHERTSSAGVGEAAAEGHLGCSGNSRRRSRSSSPQLRRISSPRVRRPVALGKIEIPACLSITRTRTPARRRAMPVLRPAGPAPTTKTSKRSGAGVDGRRARSCMGTTIGRRGAAGNP